MGIPSRSADPLHPASKSQSGDTTPCRMTGVAWHSEKVQEQSRRREGDRGTSLTKKNTPQDPTVALCLGTCGDHVRVGVSYERGTPVSHPSHGEGSGAFAKIIQLRSKTNQFPSDLSNCSRVVVALRSGDGNETEKTTFQRLSRRGCVSWCKHALRARGVSTSKTLPPLPPFNVHTESDIGLR